VVSWSLRAFNATLERDPWGRATRRAASERNVEAPLPLHRLHRANVFGVCPEQIASPSGGASRPQDPCRTSSPPHAFKEFFDQKFDYQRLNCLFMLIMLFIYSKPKGPKMRGDGACLLRTGASTARYGP